LDRTVTATRRWAPALWSLVLALLLLGPALGAGYVLSYDMVWVPDLAMRADFLGLASGLPRAVPSDAVVAVLDEVVPGALLQKLVLLGAVAAGGIGAARLAPPDSLPGRLVAVTVYQWNPFVAERLLIGHWPVLVGYAVLPWVVVLARRWRTEGAAPTALWVLVPLGCLSASAGLATGIVVLALALTRRWRHDLAVVALVLAANAPWLVAGLVHAGSATTDAAGADVFALRAAGSLPAPVAALGLGGIWNSEVVLPSRDGPLAWLSLALLVALAAAGGRAWWRREDRRDRVGLLVCWGVGYVLAVITWLAPGAMAWLVGQVPGAGLLRDGARALALCAPLLAALAGQGAAQVCGTVSRAPARIVWAGVLAVLPVTLLPDAALGLAGRLRPVDYPPAYAATRVAVAAEQDRGAEGDLLVLPLSSYRQPTWNHRHKVLDPLGRYLTPDYVASDVLVVSGTEVAGEDPRVTEVARALDQPTPDARAAALADLGIGFVAVEADAPGVAPEVSGVAVATSDDLTVLRLAAPRRRDVPDGWYVAMALAWAAWLGLGAGSLVRHVRHVRRRVLR
jgi:hypothetical protein